MKQPKTTGQNMEKGSATTIYLRLFIAGEEHNSKLARMNLKKLLNRIDRNRFEIIEIDVLKQLDKAVEYGVILTPMLQIETSYKTHTIYGNLSDIEKLVSLLSEL